MIRMNVVYNLGLYLLAPAYGDIPVYVWITSMGQVGLYF
jgi:hypothetical protein